MKPLDQISLRPRDHRAALWWLGLMYRRPAQFQEALSKTRRLRAILVGIALYLHFLPYMLLLIFASRWLLFVLLGLEMLTPVPADWLAFGLWHVELVPVGIALGIACGIAVGIALGIANGITQGIAIGIVGGIVGWNIGGIATGIVVGIATGIVVGIITEGIDPVIGIWFAGVIGGGIAVGIAVGIDYGIAVGIVVGIAIAIAFGISIPRAYYLVCHPIFFWPRLRPRWYSYHPVAWDDLCGVPFPGLDRLLAAYAELEPMAGQQELTRIIDTYPAQRMSALRAQARLIAREVGRVVVLSRLDEIVSSLPEGEKGFLKHTALLKTEISAIASCQRRLDAQTRPFLKEPESALLVEKIRNFQSRISGNPEPLGSEFRKAAGQWLKIAEAQYNQLRGILDREPRPQVFRAGDPVDREQEAFIPRFETLGELDRQLSLATGCPGVILYGRRRMGKSTLIRNLEGFLPVSVRIGALSMQNPEAFTSLGLWLNWVSEPVRAVWPERDRPEAPDSLPSFFRLLGECNKRLEAEGQRLLLAIDEYENIDRKLGEGVFPMDLLHMLRESIQTHRRIVWLFAGSHAIEELIHAEWPSYLISARTVEVPAFSEAETRLLLTEPMRHSRLFERDESKRPRFELGFWGENGIARIQAETAGWPHLVQLLAETCVDLCNERQRPLVDAALLDDAIAKAVTAGDTVLRQLLKGESSEADWAWLVGFRRLDALPIPEDEAVFLSLRRRWLVVDAELGKWRLRVPLLLRWLRERG